MVHILLKPGLSILSITLLACKMSAIVQWFEHSLALPFFGIGMKTDVLQSSGPCWVFQICWHIECRTFTASSFRIWNSSTGIPSPPLALFVVMLPKAHLTSHPGCLALGQWSHHRDYLGCEDLFLFSSSVYSYHLFLISFASVRSIPFLSFNEPIFAWNIPLISLIFGEISSPSHSIAFLYFFVVIAEEGFLISPGYSSELCIQMEISFLFSFAFASFLFTAICKASSDSHFPFLQNCLHAEHWGDGRPTSLASLLSEITVMYCILITVCKKVASCIFFSSSF